MERDRDRERDPTKTLQERLGYKIVHFVKTSVGTNTFDNDSKNIRLEPMSFPFNGRCRLFLHLIASANTINPSVGNFFVNLSLNISQPYSQTNIPFSFSDLSSKSNSIIYSAEFTEFPVSSNNLMDTYIDCVLSPNTIITLELIDESGAKCSTANNDEGYLVHLYVKSKN